jgi:hypothetical protein
MAITQAQLSKKIQDAMDFKSDDPEVDIYKARKYLADQIAEGVALFVISRKTTVAGVQSGGGTAVGIIQE